MKRLRAVAILALLAGLGLIYLGGWFTRPTPLQGSPQAELDKFARDWDAALRRYVDHGRVNYAGWRSGQAELSTHMQNLESADLKPLLSGPSSLGFWMDYYNARVVHEVLAGQSPQSAPGRTRLFGLTRFYVAGQRFSLTELETMIRRDFSEPKIHFAINCASLSCPALRSESYQGRSQDKLDQMLEEQAREFLADGFKNQFEPKSGKAHLSQIFQWYKSDFEKNNSSLSAFLAQYAPPPARQPLLEGHLTVDFIPYDWSPNGTF